MKKDLETLKREWKMSKTELIFEGNWKGQEGYLRIYREYPDGDYPSLPHYTAQYFFTLGDFGWQVSVDLNRVSISDLVRYLIEGRAYLATMNK